MNFPLSKHWLCFFVEAVFLVVSFILPTRNCRSCKRVLSRGLAFERYLNLIIPPTFLVRVKQYSALRSRNWQVISSHFCKRFWAFEFFSQNFQSKYSHSANLFACIGDNQFFVANQKNACDNGICFDTKRQVNMHRLTCETAELRNSTAKPTSSCIFRHCYWSTHLGVTFATCWHSFLFMWPNMDIFRTFHQTEQFQSLMPSQR